MSGLTDTDAALARSRAYLLLGRLFLRGVTAEIIDHVRAVEPLAQRLASLGGDGEGQVDLDEAAAAHHDVFGFNVFAYESTFLDETARAGGRVTEHVSDFYRDAGFPIVETSESPDHVGVELNFLGFLSKMEAEHDGPDAEAAREFSRAFLDTHLLRWFHGLRHALGVHGHPFFCALGDVTAELLLEHRRALGAGEGISDDEGDQGDQSAPDRSDARGVELLDDPKTGLRDIAEYLLVPADAGIYLSRASIRALSRTKNLPAGFGTRANMMSNLLRSAADYDGLEQVTEALLAHVDDTRQAWRTFADKLPDVTAPIAEAWIARLDDTEQLLGAIGQAAGSFDE
ncbi:MAG: molecular chaperone [Persicimonas sp.]